MFILSSVLCRVNERRVNERRVNEHDVPVARWTAFTTSNAYALYRMCRHQGMDHDEAMSAVNAEVKAQFDNIEAETVDERLQALSERFDQGYEASSCTVPASPPSKSTISSSSGSSDDNGRTEVHGETSIATSGPRSRRK
ncbi:unnamed protein product (mitochondrion) [Plasmodiophora brassicae]|uniref:Uncharacterized protein n=1 Tax=Plasmodiophora brassicae TaxID=37360 RepID=A0A3P3Y435_PLABS|nr:unnamed protein product [Plasmodiophora brassicae]